MIVVHVQATEWNEAVLAVAGGEPMDVYVQIPDAVCADFDRALKLWPVGQVVEMKWGVVVVTGHVKAIHQQLAMPSL